MKVDLPTWSVRNPLGTIALFISLIYGTSALLLGTSVGALAPWNQTILTIFVALFPCAVLGVFAWLVSTHHKKLYGPGDYRSDEGFLQASGQSAPQEVGGRLQEELSEDVEAVEGNTAPAQLPPAAEQGTEVGPDPDLGSTNRRLVQRAYFAEGLVFQELQDRLSGTVKRNVSLPAKTKPFRVDGVIYTSEGEYVVETVLVRNEKTLAARIDRALSRLSTLAETFPTMRLILAVVGDGLPANPDVLSAISTRRRDLPTVATFYFDLADLEAKYGFPTA